MSSLFITGHSHGLGQALCRHYLQQGYSVYGLSRSECPLNDVKLHQQQQDLSSLHVIEQSLQSLLPEALDLVILNAGILGNIQDMADTSMDETRHVMDINVWANKIIMDWLIKRQIPVRQIIMISSGASVNGNRGWGVYSISKAALNMMAKLYVEEMPRTHITAYAPGLVHTHMQDYLCQQVDSEKFPSIKALINARGTVSMPDAETAATMIATSFEQCLQYPSGSFLDLRQLSV